MTDVAIDVTQVNKAVWAAGEWDKVSDRIVEVGPKLLDKLAIGPDSMLLDVGAGSGGTIAIPAALRGATVIASDLVAEHFEDGRRRAADAGVQIEWVEADAESLPFADGSFDFVTSTFGHMFAGHHRLAAAELARVCRPGGVVATCTWTPEGFIGAMFQTIGSHLPPPEGTESPILWGTEQHVREMFEPQGLELTFERDSIDFDDGSVERYVQFHEEKFGPLVMAKARLGDDWPKLRSALIDVFGEWNQADHGRFHVEPEFLVTLGRKQR